MSKSKKSSRNFVKNTKTKDFYEPELIKKACASIEINQFLTDTSYSITKNEIRNQNKEKIMMKIESSNIQDFVQEQITKFEPPHCDNCSKKRADRVCVNKNCGNKYLQLICDQCHFDKHKDEKINTEEDIKEFFTKLAAFLNSQQYDSKKKKGQSKIDTKQLAQVFDHIIDIRQKLDYLKSKLSKEIEEYSPLSEIHATLQNEITKALSLCGFENIQEYLDRIKKSVLLKNNKFYLNDAFEKFSGYQKSIKELNDPMISINQIISDSFIGEITTDLNYLRCLVSHDLPQQMLKDPIEREFPPKDGEISIQNFGKQCQIYFDYKLDIQKQYNMRFRFEQQPTEYIMVGVMPYSQVNNQWCYNTGQHFCKRFFLPSSTHECSRILRGIDLNTSATKGMKVEIRIDFKNNYVDFTDFPDHKNINANHKHYQFASKEHYAIAFAFYKSPQHIVIESFEEISNTEEV